MQAATSATVTALLRNLKEGAPPAVQARAALGILEHATKAVELVELVERIEALETALAEAQQATRPGVRRIG